MTSAERTVYPDAFRAYEGELVIKAQQGDDAAFSALAERHRHRVSAKAKSLLNNDADAEDASQESLLSAYRHLHTLRDPGAFTGWLLTITTNVCMEQLRRGRAVVSGLEPEAATGRGCEDDLDHSELRTDLGRMISELSPQMSQLARLHYLRGLGQDDIARVLDVPLGTVSSALTRARQELRSRFERSMRRETVLLHEGLRIRTEGALGVSCLICGRHRLEWRGTRLPEGFARLETFCPDCSNTPAVPVTRCAFRMETGDAGADDLFFLGQRASLERARRVLKRTAHCPKCNARLLGLPYHASRVIRRPGNASVAWRCTRCRYSADSSVSGLLLGAAPVMRFYRNENAMVEANNNEHVRVGERNCWRVHYRNMRSQTRLTVVVDVSSLHLLSVDLDFGAKSCSLAT